MTRAEYADYVRSLLAPIGLSQLDQPPGSFQVHGWLTAAGLAAPGDTVRWLAVNELVGRHMERERLLAGYNMSPDAREAWMVAHNAAVTGLADVLAPHMPFPLAADDVKGNDAP